MLFNHKWSPKLTSDSYWSLAGSVCAAAAGLVAVRIVTTLVSPSEFGRASLVLGFVALLHGLLIGPLLVVHLRLYFDYHSRGLGQWYVREFRIALAFVVLGAGFGYIIAAGGYTLVGEPSYLAYWVPAIALIYLQAYQGAVSNYLEAHREQRRLAILNTLHRILYPCLLLVLLQTTLGPVDAILAAQGLAIVCVLAILRLPGQPRETFHDPDSARAERVRLRRSLAGFGSTVAASYAMMWVVTTGDRYLLEHFTTSRAVGIYAMNYGLWAMPFAFLNGWLEILTRPIVYGLATRRQWRRVKNVLLARMAGGGILGLTGAGILYWLGPWLGKQLLGPDYWISREFVLMIAVAHCFFVIGYAITPIFLAAKRAGATVIATGLAAALNVTANWIVIPAYGVMGAAATTLLTYVFWAATLGTMSLVLFRRLNATSTEGPEIASDGSGSPSRQTLLDG